MSKVRKSQAKPIVINDSDNESDGNGSASESDDDTHDIDNIEDLLDDVNLVEETGKKQKDGVELDEGDELDDEEDDDDDLEDELDEDKIMNPKKILNYNLSKDNTNNKIVPPEKRITSEYMTRSEYSMVVGYRAEHIAAESPIYTDIIGLSDPRDIAKKEIANNMCPLSISRKVKNGFVEVWAVNEMIKPF